MNFTDNLFLQYSRQFTWDEESLQKIYDFIRPDIESFKKKAAY